MGKHSAPGSGESASEADTGRRRRADGARRGVSVGVIVALIAVVVLVGGVILWRFFGDALARRSTDAAQQCLQGTATIAVVADPSIAANVTTFAGQYNAEATPVGDTCANVVVMTADSDAVVAGLSGTWPADLGERPALWIPASSIPAARLQAAAGKQIVSDARSLVTSPVVLAIRPEIKDALAQVGWAALPDLQTNPTSLDGRNLPGWGSLRLALPATGAGDATYLTVEAVAAASAPPGAAATAGLAAARGLLAAAPELAASAETGRQHRRRSVDRADRRRGSGNRTGARGRAHRAAALCADLRSRRRRRHRGGVVSRWPGGHRRLPDRTAEWSMAERGTGRRSQRVRPVHGPRRPVGRVGQVRLPCRRCRTSG
ncbi:MAG: hypothetical protein NTY24_05715 [Mycobacterium sp.]|nr:hypothetical protein [Mycobacterium sp.]